MTRQRRGRNSRLGWPAEGSTTPVAAIPWGARAALPPRGSPSTASPGEGGKAEGLASESTLDQALLDNQAGGEETVRPRHHLLE